jgi:hypothetical protein
MPRQSPFHIELSVDELDQLGQLARQYTSPYFLVMRAKIVLLASQGRSNDEIARKLDVPRQVVSKWRKRFFETRMAGLNDLPRSGRPPVFSPSSRRRSQGPGL